MPIKAYMNIKTGTPILANKVKINEKNNTFICCTPSCNAEMILVGAGTGNAYFRSKNIKKHISNQCIKNSITFNPSKYDENYFDLNFAFESMLGLNHSIRTIDRGITGIKKGNVGGSKKLRIHTLPLLYAMCLSVGKSGFYNKISINELLADNENYNKYYNGIEGYRIVETSMYHKVKDEFAFIMNYPAENFGLNSWVKIIFQSKDIFWKQYDKLKNSNHIEPIIIAGNWEIVKDTSDYHSQCIIYTEDQIYYAKEK